MSALDTTNEAINTANAAVDAADAAKKGQLNATGVLAMAGSGATIGASIGLLGGPFAPITSTVGGAVGGAVMAAVGGGIMLYNKLKPRKIESNPNNATLRKELDLFTIPSDFVIEIYAGNNPDVWYWANNLGLNDEGYVRKAIAYHYYVYGRNEGRPYPYEDRIFSQVSDVAWNTYVNSPKIESGKFDWVGGQNNGIETGFHTLGVLALKQGDYVEISGAGVYDGVHKVSYIGSDDGGYLLDMFTIDFPKTVAASGTFRKVSNPNTPWIIGGVVVFVGLVFVVIKFIRKWKK